MKTLLVLREELMNNGSYTILDEIWNHECKLKKHLRMNDSDSLQFEIQNLEHNFNELESKFRKDLSRHEDTIREQSVSCTVFYMSISFYEIFTPLT